MHQMIFEKELAKEEIASQPQFCFAQIESNYTFIYRELTNACIDACKYGLGRQIDTVQCASMRMNIAGNTEFPIIQDGMISDLLPLTLKHNLDLQATRKFTVSHYLQISLYAQTLVL